MGLCRESGIRINLENGHPIRLSGQDCERGTFAHRHAVVHNQKERGMHQPLKQLFDGQPSFRVINSLLSEEAVLAFEYGFSTAEPENVWCCGKRNLETLPTVRR